MNIQNNFKEAKVIVNLIIHELAPPCIAPLPELLLSAIPIASPSVKSAISSGKRVAERARRRVNQDLLMQTFQFLTHQLTGFLSPDYSRGVVNGLVSID